MRLNKFLARSGVASRRSSEALILAGRVRVNGQVVSELATQVEPAADVVELDDKRVEPAAEAVTLVLNKPVGTLTTMSDPEGRPCVASLVPIDTYPGLFPIGRLDMDTTGTLLFTTDGELGQRLAHPSFEKNKTYCAVVNGELSQEDLRKFETAGAIVLEDGPCAAASIQEVKRYVLSDLPKNMAQALQEAGRHGIRASVYRLTIHEGRRHQVKRMFQALGFRVLALHRDTFGPIGCDGLRPGQWRLLSAEEQKQLQS